jgi:hypothetical protein
MAATVTRAKTGSSSKPAKKATASRPGDLGPQLQIRYWKVMKPQRVYALVVTVPARGKKGGEAEEEPARGGLVVVRPVIPGAQVVPAEQRYEVAPGNQITFQVTPLARGRLPRARLEVFAPGQPPEIIPLPMKAKTHRLALVLLFLAWAIPTFLVSWLMGGLRPLGQEELAPPEEFDKLESALKDEKSSDAVSPRAIRQYNKLAVVFATPMKEYLPAIPLVNQPVKFLQGEGGGKGDSKDFTIADRGGDYLARAYVWLQVVRGKYPWVPNTIGAAFVFLAFVAWMWNDPRRKRVRHAVDLDLKPSREPQTEAAMLEPL